MSLPLDVDVLRSCYNFIISTKPFIDFNLPDGDDITFKIVKSKRYCGWHEQVGGEDIIAISDRFPGPTQELLKTMAHEVLHLIQTQLDMPRGHGKVFKEWAKQICEVHGCDVREF